MIGSTIDKYRILELLGEGGMGMVYRAEHVVLGSPAAVKVLLPQLSRDAVAIDRLFNEARATSAIRHVGIVQVFDYGRLPNGQAFIAMELLRGEDLASFLARQPRGVPPQVAAQIALQLFSALESSHLIGVVHRDLKPDNIFLVRDPSAPGAIRVKVLDFGIAKLVGDQLGPSVKTRGSTILGTPTYMSPEQCRGRELDGRSDLYSVGCILFELLTGKPPFEASAGGELLAKHIYEAPPRLAQVAPHLPAELDALMSKLLAKSPAERTPSAAWALAALERVPLVPLRDLVPIIVTELPEAAHPVSLPAFELGPSSSGAFDRERIPRWIPVTVVAVALVLAATAAAAIGLT